MSFREHLNELRVRVMHIVIAVAGITIFCMAFDLRPVEFAGLTLAYPFPDAIHNVSARIILYMQHTLLPAKVTLIQTAPGQAFFAQVYVSILAGVIGSMPVIVAEIAGFISPAISPQARSRKPTTPTTARCAISSSPPAFSRRRSSIRTPTRPIIMAR